MNLQAHDLKTLRLLFPQWQGGYDESEFPGQIYPLGARLLAWLAPAGPGPLLEVPVTTWNGQEAADKEGGVFYRQAILRQLRAARQLIQAQAPDRVITFGGDCLISQAPFAYLNERYAGKIGLIWIDAHPDVSTPDDFDHAHAMVLGNLLGRGEPLLAAEVKRPYRPEQVALVGVDGVLPYERSALDRFGLRVIPSREIPGGGQAVTAWIRDQGFERVAIHLDLDVLNPARFRSLLFANPNLEEPVEAEQGKADLADIGRLLRNISAQVEVVGMSFAEYMPWEALGLKKLLAELPFLS